MDQIKKKMATLRQRADDAEDQVDSLLEKNKKAESRISEVRYSSVISFRYILNKPIDYDCGTSVA